MSCSKFVLINTGSTVINFNYQRCNDALWEYQVELNPGQTKNIWLINDTFSIADVYVNNIEVQNWGSFPPTTISATPNPTSTPTPTPTNTPDPSPTNTPTNTATPTETPLVSPTNTPTNTGTPSETPTNTPTSTITPTITPSPTSDAYRNFTIQNYWSGGLVITTEPTTSFDSLFQNVFPLGAGQTNAWHGPIVNGDTCSITITGLSTYQWYILRNGTVISTITGNTPDSPSYTFNTGFTEDDILRFEVIS